MMKHDSQNHIRHKDEEQGGERVKAAVRSEKIFAGENFDFIDSFDENRSRFHDAARRVNFLSINSNEIKKVGEDFRKTTFKALEFTAKSDLKASIESGNYISVIRAVKPVLDFIRDTEDIDGHSFDCTVAKGFELYGLRVIVSDILSEVYIKSKSKEKTQDKQSAKLSDLKKDAKAFFEETKKSFVLSKHGEEKLDVLTTVLTIYEENLKELSLFFDSSLANYRKMHGQSEEDVAFLSLFKLSEEIKSAFSSICKVKKEMSDLCSLKDLESYMSPINKLELLSKEAYPRLAVEITPDSIELDDISK